MYMNGEMQCNINKKKEYIIIRVNFHVRNMLWTEDIESISMACSGTALPFTFFYWRYRRYAKM
jgi:hypothetical protein